VVIPEDPHDPCDCADCAASPTTRNLRAEEEAFEATLRAEADAERSDDSDSDGGG
jgi:hypothetical protein